MNYWAAFSEKKLQLEQQLRGDKHLQILISFVLFAMVFYASLFTLRVYLAVFKRNHHLKQVDLINLASRIVSTVHALVSTALAIRTLFTDPDIHENKLKYLSFDISLMGSIYIGYVFFDMASMFVYKELLEWEFILHHIVSAVAFYATAMSGMFAYIAITRLTSEGSTLFINIRWTLILLKMKDTKYYTWNGIMIILSFTLFRILPIVPMWYTLFHLFQHPLWPEVHIGYKLLCIGSSVPLDALNVFWYSKILRMAVNILRPKSRSTPTPAKQD